MGSCTQKVVGVGGGGGQCSKMHARGEGLKVVSYSQVGSLEPY